MLINDLITKIDEIREEVLIEFEKSRTDGDLFARSQSVLSIYLGSLGDAVASLDVKVNDMKTAQKLEEIDAYLKHRNSEGKVSVEDAKAMSKKETSASLMELNKAENQLVKVKAKYDNTKQLIISIQVQLSYMKSERMNQGIEGK